MEFEELIKKRHSVREYANKEIEKEKIEKIINIASSAPSAGNLKAYKIIIITDRKTKEALYYSSLEQDSILQAGAVLVFLADQNQSSKRYGKRGAELYSIQDATIAAAYAQLEICNLGLCSVWIGAFNEEEIKKHLKLKQGEVPIAIIPIGYRKYTPPTK